MRYPSLGETHRHRALVRVHGDIYTPTLAGRKNNLLRFACGRHPRSENRRSKQQCALLAARGAQAESLAGEGPEEIVSALRIHPPDSGNALGVVAASEELLAYRADVPKTKAPLTGGVAFVVLLTERFEVLLKDLLQRVASPWSVSARGLRWRRCGRRGSRILQYGSRCRPASPTRCSGNCEDRAAASLELQQEQGLLNSLGLYRDISC